MGKWLSITKKLAHMLLFRVLIRPSFPPTVTDETTIFILTVWRREYLSPGWEEEIGEFDAISVKICDGDSRYRSIDAIHVLDICTERGLSCHGWGFHYCRNGPETEREAEAAVEACRASDVVAYHWNAEKQWLTGDDPIEEAIRFAKIFKKALPYVDLYANCFSGPVTAGMLKYFDRYEPMLYGTRRKTIESKFKQKVGGMEIGSAKKCAMVGTGRKDAGNDRRAWGYLHPPEGQSSPMGLAQLVDFYGPYAVNFFRAGRADGEDIMVRENSINPKLSVQVAEIKTTVQGRA